MQAAPAHIVCNVLASSGDCACELPQARGGFSASALLLVTPVSKRLRPIYTAH